MKYPINQFSCIGGIYILKNPMFSAIKIGYATDIETRRNDLSKSSAIPLDFEVYAYYEVSKNAADKTLHSLISLLNPELRINPGKEFFNISAENAYKILEKIAILSDTESRLHLINEDDTSDVDSDGKKIIRSPFNFLSAKMNIGDKIEFYKEKAIKRFGNPEISLDFEAVVSGSRTIKFNNEETSTSTLTLNILKKAYPSINDNFTVNGNEFWLFNDETLWDRRLRLEQEGNYN